MFHSRMWDDQMIGMENKIIVEEKVEVKSPILVSVDVIVANTAVPLLDRLQ